MKIALGGLWLLASACSAAELPLLMTDDGPAVFIYPPAQVTLNNLRGKDDCGMGWVKIGRFALTAADPQRFNLEFQLGCSNDPLFIIRDADGQQLLAATGLTLTLDDQGGVLVKGYSNSAYDQQRLYRFNGQAFAEVPQPFYAVGISSRLQRSETLWSDQQRSVAITELAAGSEVEVIAQDGAYWLVKSANGLLGWIAHHQTNDSFDSPFTTIRHRGD